MPDRIQLLPDSLANQIAAGEVVQRPASAVKELLENAVDAESTSIQLIVRDGGKSLIQVVDNGTGMSETDARLSFERHATSKIREVSDLYAIRTMGFRGEALASIAAVAEVELRTRRQEDQVGVCIQIAGSELQTHEPTATPKGTSICVKNLFYNVPARRKFLKSHSLELKHIISEFQRIALANPHIALSLSHNGADIYNLPPAAIKQRVVNLMGRNMNQHLLDLTTETSVVKISGFIGRPQSAKKSPGEQFFFVNNRFMRNPYLHKAVIKAYEKVLQPETIPPYFIFLELNPESIDVNIHPTKTEVKFEDERIIWQIINAAVREALGKFAVVPSIDFDTEMVIDIPFFPKSAPVSPPEVEMDPHYNPFDTNPVKAPKGALSSQGHKRQSVKGWQDLFHEQRGQGFEDNTPQDEPHQSTINHNEDDTHAHKPAHRFFQFKGRYILSPVKSGLMVIDQRRAHERILYEGFLSSLSADMRVIQQELFPQTIELNPADFAILMDNKATLETLGVEVSNLGGNTLSVNALPGNIKVSNPEQFLTNLLDTFKANAENPEVDAHQRMALSMARAAAVPYTHQLNPIEMQDIVDKLFACQHPNISPEGKPVLTIIGMDEVERRFKG